MTSLSKPRRHLHLLLAALGGALQFLGYAGFGIWPLAFVAYLPMLYIVHAEPEASTKRILLLGWIHGFVTHAGGYYWLVPMLQNFSGYGPVPSTFFASVFWAYSGCQQMLVYWLVHRASRKGFSPTWATAAALVAAEQYFPALFPSQIGDGLHVVLPMIQIVDLGGASLLTLVVVLPGASLFAYLLAKREGKELPLRTLVIAFGLLSFNLAYGFWRIADVDAQAAEARTFRVGSVQVGMGIFEKREDPWEGHRRHLRQSARLEREGELDLLVWPESAFTFFLPEGVTNVRRHVLGDIESPTLFGGLARRTTDGEEHHYNTAFLAGSDGEILGTYDKTYLLAFGEYMPLGDLFPILYDLSPNSGHFTAGNHVRPLTLPTEEGEVRVSTLICYEDVLSGFTRRAVQEGNPHLLANITNDAWFGDTHEPWIHLALAKFRAIEHHRSLVRSTNSGVSAIVDPVGRELAIIATDDRDEIAAEVPLMTEATVFETVGDWPGWMGLLAIGVMVFWRRRSEV